MHGVRIVPENAVRTLSNDPRHARRCLGVQQIPQELLGGYDSTGTLIR